MTTPDPHPRTRPPTAPATGAARRDQSELTPEEEPSTPGTLFLCTVLLMIIAGFWIIIYLRLLKR